VILFLVAVACRLFLFIYIHGADFAADPKFLLADAGGYDQLAVNIWQHGVFSQSAGEPYIADSVRTPVFPAFLAAVYALVGHAPGIAIAMQAVVASLSAPLTFLLALELRLNAVAAAVAGLVVAVDPVSIVMANLLLTEALFATLLVAGLLMLARYWRTQCVPPLIASAVLVALTALTRPISQFLPFVLLPGFALAFPRGQWTRALSGALVFLLVSMGILLAWSYRNYHENGVVTISTIGNESLLYYRAAPVLALAEGIEFQEAYSRLQVQVEQEVAARHLNLAETGALQRELALGILAEHPILTAKLTGVGAATVLLEPGLAVACDALADDATPANCSRRVLLSQPGTIPLAPRITLLWGLVLLGVVYAGAFVGALVLYARRNWLPLALLLLVIVYFVAVSTTAAASSRFRVPVFPYVSILFGVGACSIWSLLTGWRSGEPWRGPTRTRLAAQHFDVSERPK
jgi:hypothetical protein